MLALDVGDKKIGVAVSDAVGILASPLTVIRRETREGAISEVLRLAGEYQVKEILVGLPRTMAGDTGSQAVKVQGFGAALQAITDLPVIFRDERLTTVSAKRLLREKGKRRAEEDAIAAALILQGYLEESR
ncbi:MAG: Holliday junction resolvase RuvX [Chloroflexota bacterium]